MRISAIGNLKATVSDMFNFEDQLKNLSLKIYPSVALKELIVNDLIPIVKQLRDILISEIKALEENEQHVISSKAKAVNKIWFSRRIQFVASAISGTDLKSYPLEIMEIFKEMIKNIDGENFELLTSPIDQLNFTFQEIWHPIKKLLENEVGVTSNNNKKFVKLTFPSQHKDNVFLSGIYAHEIGHYFDRNRGLWSKIFAQKVLSHPYLNKLGKFFFKQNNHPASIAEISSFLHDTVLGAWLREAIADCVAIYLLGPAFIFSSSDLLTSVVGTQIIQTGSLIDVPSHTHPRDGLRFKFQLSVLRKLKLYDPLHEKIKEILDTLEKDWEQAQVVYQPNIISRNYISFMLNQESYQILERIWEECLSLVVNEVEALIGDNLMKPCHIEEAMRLAEERIKWLVPPNELDGKPANAKAILNSGWFAKLLGDNEILSRVQSLDGEKSEYNFLGLLNGLMKYALHASTIQERWGN
ncbi:MULTISPECIES: hypothetical protein [Bacillaceae]|jgi:hypothetical protein|uniref:Uncharacterized protein n=1 Tax=Parageobacillus galactosidasius TaxID=883812 RepID=A0A226QKA1_9BACL|nr:MULTISPECIES: hypothetical protein [Bacillaceae]QNU35685.1 hypothetical protein IC802_07340 [Geobacillus sp. 44C]ARP44303.1 hypothetical protein GTHT12_02807 [Geobacillus thermodenitrificans]MCK7604887.1 hypothetical protein [Geobacillus stearothermophilus]OXB91862.1 hypothetical protein B9L23_11260 [Parageobacillus galactosidasius]GLH64139.1 hypothetical protein PG301_19780 [Parageobacillus sp. G301]